jgi:hypothetical protein
MGLGNINLPDFLMSNRYEGVAPTTAFEPFRFLVAAAASPRWGKFGET